MPATPTARLKLPLPAETDPADVPVDLAKLAGPLDTAAAVFVQGALGTRPAAGLVGRFFWATDLKLLYYDDGAAWTPVSLAGRTWYLTGDNSGDSNNNNSGNVAFTNLPRFHTTTGTWYRARANYVVSGYIASGAALAMYTGLYCGTLSLMRRSDMAVSLAQQSVALEWVLQAPAGDQDLSLGHRPAAANTSSYIMNSGGFIPVLHVEELAGPPLMPGVIGP